MRSDAKPGWGVGRFSGLNRTAERRSKPFVDLFPLSAQLAPGVRTLGHVSRSRPANTLDDDRHSADDELVAKSSTYHKRDHFAAGGGMKA